MEFKYVRIYNNKKVEGVTDYSSKQEALKKIKNRWN